MKTPAGYVEEEAAETQSEKEKVISQEVVSHRYEEVTALLQKNKSRNGVLSLPLENMWLSRAGGDIVCPWSEVFL